MGTLLASPPMHLGHANVHCTIVAEARGVPKPHIPYSGLGGRGQGIDSQGFVVHDPPRAKQEDAMKRCPVCRMGEVAPGKATVTPKRGGTTVVIRSVPTAVCRNCGEEFIDEETTRKVMGEAEQAVRDGVQVEVREYNAVREGSM
jgi:YgiT-type zinc finger domain-containing protein